jgi:hypothetical protein
MKNQNLIIGGTVVMLLIGLYLYFTVKKANAATSETTIAPNLLTGPNSTNNSEPSGTQGPSSIKKPAATTNTVKNPISSWLDWLTGSGSNPLPSQPQYSAADNSSAFPLKNGSTGEEVKNLQTWLNNHVILPYSFLNVDGKFGPLTLSALKRTLGVSEVTEAWYRVNILNTPSQLVNKTSIPIPEAYVPVNIWDIPNSDTLWNESIMIS